MHNSIPHKVAGEMCVGNTYSMFFFQPVLVSFTEQLTKCCAVTGFRAAEPHIDKRLLFVAIRHGRINAVQIDLAENKVTHILNPMATHVAPKAAGALDVPLELPPMERGHRAIEGCNRGEAGWSPVHIFAVASVVGVHARIMADEA